MRNDMQDLKIIIITLRSEKKNTSMRNDMQDLKIIMITLRSENNIIGKFYELSSS
jgi:hypothetical protein